MKTTRRHMVLLTCAVLPSGTMAAMKPQWTRVNLDIFRNPKFMRVCAHPAGPKATVAYIESVLWSVEHLTDGMLPDWYKPSPMFKVPAHALNLLVEAGLWLEVHQAFRIGMPGDEHPRLEHARWLINDFTDYAITREEWHAYVSQRQSAARSRWFKRPELRVITSQDDDTA